MSTKTRTTVYFDDNLHKALRLKAAETEQGISDLVNTAVRDEKMKTMLLCDCS